MTLSGETLINRIVQALEAAIAEGWDRESLPFSDGGRAGYRGFTRGLKQALRIVMKIEEESNG